MHAQGCELVVVQTGADELLVFQREAERRIKCNWQPVLAHRRMMLPVFGGISGWYRITWNMKSIR